MQNKKENRNTIIIVGFAIVAVIVGILYLRAKAGSSSFVAQYDGYDMYRVSLEDAKAAFDNDEALFLDVRSQASFDKSHIPDAIVIPLNELAGNEPQVDKGALIYAYCT